jgi:hypothetical protein
MACDYIAVAPFNTPVSTLKSRHCVFSHYFLLLSAFQNFRHHLFCNFHARHSNPIQGRKRAWWGLATGEQNLFSGLCVLPYHQKRHSPNIRVLDQHPSLEYATDKDADESIRSIHGLFTCPVGSPMNELLSAIPSGQGAGRPLVFPGHTEQPLSKHR